MKKNLPLIVCALFITTFSKAQAVKPFTTCPNVNVAVAREGFNADTQNPYYIYSVNTTTGGVTKFAGGPLVRPDSTSINMQVNGVGLNKVDGFMYGLDFEGTTNTARFVKFDYAYGVTLFGNVAPPTSSTGVLSFVNSAAGDIDQSNNYYFTAFTANPSSPSSYIIDKLFLGKISNISTIAGGSPTAAYYEIDFSDANCNGYISTLSSDPNNSGIKDITFNAATGSFFIYATYKPTGAANFSGQLLELKPISGSSPLKYKLVCNPMVNTHTAETAGSLIDNSGNFLVLLTDGTMGKLQSSGSAFNYTGAFTTLNNSTGLPSPLRGDLASCGAAAAGPLAISLSSFKANANNCKINFSWTSENEINFNHYELEQSFDDITFASEGIVNAANNGGASSYGFTLSSPSQLAYYRLKMVDDDGRISYSNILPVNSACSKTEYGFIVNPNPVRSSVNLNWYGVGVPTTMKINIYNEYGKMVSSTTNAVSPGSSIVNINAATLASGVYFIQATDTKTNESLQQRFVKQ